MKSVKNERLIKRNGQIGQWTTFGALGVMGVGVYISFQTQRPDLYPWALAALVVGFGLTQVGMFFSSRWGRSPRPDEQLDAALKGLPNDDSLYHYVSPVSHLYVGSAGVWILHPLQQRGRLTYAKNRWRLSGGGFMQSYMTIFGQEGLGRPDLELAHDVEASRKFLITGGMAAEEVPEIHGALVLTNEHMEGDDRGAPMPAVPIKKLKDFMRQKAKDRPIDRVSLQKIRSVLPAE